MSGAEPILVRMRAALDRGDADGAALHAADAAEMEPAARLPRLVLAEFAQRRGEWAIAASHLRAVESDAASALQLGIVLVRMGRYAEAIAPFSVAAREGTDRLGSTMRLAWVYERLGRFEDLAETLEHARPLAAAAGVDLTVRTAILNARAADWRASLDTLDRAAQLTGEDRLARGRLRDRAGRYRDAWTDFVTGKRQIAEQTNQTYPFAPITAHFAQLHRCLTAELVRSLRWTGSPSASPQPVFIGGAPRSGTTLLEAQLAGGDLAPRGELPATFAMAQRAAALPGGYPGGLQGLAEDEVVALSSHLREQYLASADNAVGAVDTPRFIDKSPWNEQYLPLIAMAFPAAPVVVLSRHPLDVIISMMSHHMTHGFGCALDPVAAATHIAAIDELSQHWSAAGLAFHSVRYEDLVTDDGAALENVASYIGTKRTGTGGGAAHTAATPSYSQVQEPVNASAIGRWRNYAPYLTDLASIVSPAAIRRGYELTVGGQTS